MESIIEKYQKDINKLVEQGKKLLYGMFSECRDDYADYFKKMPKDVRDGIYALEFKPLYNAWYNESLALIRQLVPDRVDDFVSYYKRPCNPVLIVPYMRFDNYCKQICLTRN